jgi:hypothetical protein
VRFHDGFRKNGSNKPELPLDGLEARPVLIFLQEPGMKDMLRIFAAAIMCFVLAGCANNIPRDYSGRDAGYLIVALGSSASTEYSRYVLLFRKKKSDQPANGNVTYVQEKAFTSINRDFDGRSGNGIVEVRNLPAGEYEIYNFGIYKSDGTQFKAKDDFSIPFTINPGVATYLGEFKAEKITGRNLIGMNVSAGAFFVIGDMQQRDIPIAKAKSAFIKSLAVAIPDVKAIANPLFQTPAVQ